MDPLTIAGEEFDSRLLLGTGGVPSLEVLEKAIVSSGTELVTVALRRVEASTSGPLLEVLEKCKVRLLPNTAGCMTAREAVLTAKLAREATAQGFDAARWSAFRRLGQDFSQRILAHVQKEEAALLPLIEEAMDADTEARLYGAYVENE